MITNHNNIRLFDFFKDGLSEGADLYDKIVKTNIDTERNCTVEKYFRISENSLDKRCVLIPVDHYVEEGGWNKTSYSENDEYIKKDKYYYIYDISLDAVVGFYKDGEII